VVIFPIFGQPPRRLSENVGFRQNKAKFGEKAQFTGVNEHFEPNFNAVLAERCVFGQTPSKIWQKTQLTDVNEHFEPIFSSTPPLRGICSSG
jgi:hypothetical protein